MDLAHLAKGSTAEDLFDTKKNPRLLSAIVSKLESRHNGSANLLAAVRKVQMTHQNLSVKIQTVYKIITGEDGKTKSCSGRQATNKKGFHKLSE